MVIALAGSTLPIIVLIILAIFILIVLARCVVIVPALTSSM